MAIGNYFELLSYVDDVANAEKFYESIGFTSLGSNVWTDGSYNLRLIAGSGPVASFQYFGCSIQEIENLGEEIISPNGVDIQLHIEDAGIPMPGGEPLKRASTAILGLFGEFSIPVKDIDREADFWRQFGYQWTLKEEEPYPWGILLGPRHVIGVHQVLNGKTDWVFREPTITYFDKQMSERLSSLKDAGIAYISLGKNDAGDDVAAKIEGPGGLMFFMFTGEVV